MYLDPTTFFNVTYLVRATKTRYTFFDSIEEKTYSDEFIQTICELNFLKNRKEVD